MSKIKNVASKLNLSQYKTWINETTENSKYFNLSEIPTILTAGRNTFLIDGSTNLINTTKVLLELLDANGNPVYISPVKNYAEGTARVVTIDIYQDTAPGFATLTILGHVARDENGNLPPAEFASSYNVRWQKKILIAPNRQNETKIRLVTKPQITIREALSLYRQASQSVDITSTGGTLNGNLVIDGGVPYTVIGSTGISFDRFYDNAELRATINGVDFTSSIDYVINSGSARISSSFYASASVQPSAFSTTNYNIIHTPQVVYSLTELTRSFADVTIGNLRTIGGDISRAKLYVKSIDQQTDYQQIADVRIGSVELSTTQSFTTGEQIISFGNIISSSIISSYWNSGQVTLDNRYVNDPTVLLERNIGNLLDSVHISSPATLATQSADRPLYYLGFSKDVTFTKDLEYTFGGTLRCINSTSVPARMDVYLFGAAFISSSQSPLGILVDSFEVPANTGGKYFENITTNFIAPIDGTASLRFVVWGGDWYIRDAGIFTIEEFGFNPDETKIIVPVVGRRYERLQFKLELYDLNNNLAPIDITSDPIFFDGGNIIIRGADARIDGTVTVAPSGSGPTLSSRGFQNRGGDFVPGQSIFIGPTIPRVKSATTAFFAGTSSAGPEISVGDKMYGYYDTGSNQFILTIDGTLLIVTGSNSFDVASLFPRIVMNTLVTSQTSTTMVISASAYDPLNVVTASVTYSIYPPNEVTVSPLGGGQYTISRPLGGNVAQVVFTGQAANRYPGTSTVLSTPLPTSSSINFLKLNLTITSSTDTTVGISGSVINAFGTSVGYGLLNTSNVGTIVKDGESRWTLQRPVSGFGQVTMAVSSSDASIVADYDSLFIQAAAAIDPLNFLQLQLNVTSSTLQSVGISASVSSTLVPYGFGIIQSSNVGPITVDGVGRWTIQRPTSGEGSVVIIVSGANALTISDQDTLYVSRDPSPYLTVRATNIAANQTSITASVEVFDSNNVTSSLGGVTLVSSSAALIGLTASLSGTVSQSVGKNTYIYYITRPQYEQGTGRVTFTATKSNYVQDSDSIEIPERVDRLATVVVDLYVTQTSPTIIVSASVSDPLGLVAPTLSSSFRGNIVVTGSNPYNITYPPFGDDNARFTVFATAPNRVPDSDSIDIPAEQVASGYLFLSLTKVSSSADSIIVSASVQNTAGTATNVSILQSNNVGTIVNNSTNIWTINRPTSGEGSVIFKVTGSSGYIEDSDTMFVSKDNLVNLDVRAIATTLNATEVTASVSLRDPYTNTGTITGALITSSSVGLTGFSSRLYSSTTGSGVITNVYHITRPNYGQGTERINFLGSKTGYSSDADSIEIPERVDGIPSILVRTFISTIASASMVVSASVHDPLGLVTPTLSMSFQGGAGVVGSNPFTVTYPGFGSGSARMTLFGYGSGRATGSATVDIPETNRDSIPLLIKSEVLSANSGSTSVRVTVANPVALPNRNITITFATSSNVPSASGSALIISSSITSDLSTSGFVDYVINRPTQQAGTGRITFVASMNDRISVSNGVDIPDIWDVPLQLVMVAVSESSTQLFVSSSVNRVPYGSGTPTVSVQSSHNVATPTFSSPNWVINRPPSGSGRVVFQNALAGKLGDTDSVDVLPVDVFSDASFLGLNLTVVTASANSMTVSASVQNTSGKSTNVSIFKSNNVGTITNPSTNVWTITRPTGSEGTVTFKVTASASDRLIEDYDTVYVTKDNLVRLDVRAFAAGIVTATGMTASVVIRDPYFPSGTLSGITVTSSSLGLGGFSSNLYNSANTNGTITNTYHISRPNYGTGTERITFLATKTGYSSDSDSLEIPERVDGIARLRVVVSPIGTTDTAVSLSVRVTDSIPSTGSYIHLSVVGTGTGLISPNSSSNVANDTTAIYTIGRPVFGSGIGRVTFSATASIGRASDSDAFDVSESPQNSLNPANSTFTVTSVTSGSASINVDYTIPSTSTTQFVRVWALESSGSAPTLSSVEFQGYEIPASPLEVNDGRTQFSVPVTLPGNWIQLSFVPFDQLSRRGTVVNKTYQSTVISVSPPSPFTSPTFISSTSGSVTNRLTMPNLSNPDYIRTYRNGSVYGTDTARTASFNTTQTITHTGLDISTTYNWEYSGVSSGIESTKTTVITGGTQNGGTINTPSLYFSGYIGVNLRFVVTPGANTPGDAEYTLYVYNESLVLIDIIGPIASTVIEAPFGRVPATGYARVFASRTNYTDSALSAYEAWATDGGEPR